MIGRVLNLARKELLQLARSRLLVFLVILGPLAELLLVGWGTSQAIEHLPTAIVDLDQSRESRQLIQALENSRDFDITYYGYDQGEVDHLLDQGEVSVAVVIPHGFAAELIDPDRSAQVQVILDGSHFIVAAEAQGSAEAAIANFQQSIIAEQSGWSETTGAIETSVRVWFNETLSRSVYVIPSEMTQMLIFVTVALAALGIARERERGTLEQLLISPLRSAELFIGKAIPVVIVAFIEFILMLIIVTSLFHIPLQGSVAILLIFVFFYILVELGWGITISVFSRTQMQALVLVFLLIMVETIFSGYAVPTESMPTVMQWISNLFPIKHFLVVFKGIMVKGAPISAFPVQLGAIFMLGVGIWTIAILSLRRRRLE